MFSIFSHFKAFLMVCKNEKLNYTQCKKWQKYEAQTFKCVQLEWPTLENQNPEDGIHQLVPLLRWQHL